MEGTRAPQAGWSPGARCHTSREPPPPEGTSLHCGPLAITSACPPPHQTSALSDFIFVKKEKGKHSSVVLIPIFLTTNKMQRPFMFTVHSYFLFCEIPKHLFCPFIGLLHLFKDTFSPHVNISWIGLSHVL